MILLLPASRHYVLTRAAVRLLCTAGCTAMKQRGMHEARPLTPPGLACCPCVSCIQGPRLAMAGLAGWQGVSICQRAKGPDLAVTCILVAIHGPWPAFFSFLFLSSSLVHFDRNLSAGSAKLASPDETSNTTAITNAKLLPPY